MSQPNFDNMTAEEIKAFIESQPAAEQPSYGDEEDQGQPRDEQGRFVSPNPEPAAEEEPTEEEIPEMYVREIDLGDGSGVQVFKAPTLEELADKLAEAQVHATRKIRELSQRTTETPAPVAPAVPNPDDEARLSQQLLSAPTATIRDLMVREFGMTPTEIKAKLEQANMAAKAVEADVASREFVAANPDFYPCDANGNKILKWLELNRKEGTVENITAAYQDLNTSGLLVSKPTETAAPRAARSSGLSTRRSAAPPAQKPVDTSKLTTDQLRELAGGYQNPY